MILFCDTSALIKLLIDEPGSDLIHQASQDADAIAACRITWAEAMAAMARRQREDPVSADAIEQARQRLNQLWTFFAIVEVSQDLVETAGRFADGFALRVTTACNWLPPTHCKEPRPSRSASPASIVASIKRPSY